MDIYIEHVNVSKVSPAAYIHLAKLVLNSVGIIAPTWPEYKTPPFCEFIISIHIIFVKEN